MIDVYRAPFLSALTARHFSHDTREKVARKFQSVGLMKTEELARQLLELLDQGVTEEEFVAGLDKINLK